MNWGTRLVIAFIVFIGMIATMITVCMKQDVYLVSKDYYKQEIAYEDRIQEIKNTKNLGESLQLSVDYQNLQATLKMPETLKGADLEGEVHFFCPSDASKDVKLPLKPDAQGVQQISLASLTNGFWRVKVSWNDGQKSYFDERTLQL